MMGRQDRDQGQLFYEFNLDDVVPKEHLLRRMNVFVAGVLADVHQHLKPFYSDIGRPSVDPERGDAHNDRTHAAALRVEPQAACG